MPGITVCRALRLASRVLESCTTFPQLVMRTGEYHVTRAQAGLPLTGHINLDAKYPTSRFHGSRREDVECSNCFRVCCSCVSFLLYCRGERVAYERKCKLIPPAPSRSSSESVTGDTRISHVGIRRCNAIPHVHARSRPEYQSRHCA